MLERVAIARGRCVQRDAERVGDLLEGEFAPRFEDDDFTQRGGEIFHGAFEFIVRRGFDGGRLEPIGRGLLAECAAVVAPREVDGAAADRGENERGIRRASAAPPPHFHQRILEHILRIGLAAGLIPREKQEAARAGFEPGAPVMG